MGWSQSLGYVKAIALKTGVVKPKEHHEDEGLPFGAKIGGTLTIQSSPFLKAALAGSLIVAPAPGTSVIQSISRLKIDFPGAIYRYYLATGDSDAKEAFLQVVKNVAGEVIEAMYCTQVSRFIPETVEDQDNFMATNGRGLGEKVYSLYPDQLVEQGFTEQQIQSFLQGAELIEYFRESGDPETNWVPPFQGEEVRIDDATGEHGLSQDIWFVPYARQLGDQREYLLITTEVLKSQDGDDSRRNIHVDFDVALPLDIQRITIL